MRRENDQDRQVAAFLTLNVEVHDILDEYHPKFGYMRVPGPHPESPELVNLGRSKFRSLGSI